ncbi:putative secreted protein [Neisseria sp. HSC-16F19]|nr:SIMPL domain-containing protein [Neisseria sp. HSC-16F19]MCP2041591.1 putative secreted protein [Neisseria sp. HSC-16F19]
MKKYAWTLAACLAAATAGADTLNYGLVSLDVAASREITRDQMVLLLNIEAEGQERQPVADAASRKINAVVQAAARHKDFNTLLQSRSTHPRYDYVNGRRVDKGWQDTAVIRIQSKNMAALNAFAAQMQPYAAIGNIHYGVSAEAFKTHEAELTREAIRQFHARAQEVSRQLGGRGYKLVQLNIGNGRGGGQMPVVMMAADAMAKSAVVQESAPGEAQIRLHIGGQIQVQGLD